MERYIREVRIVTLLLVVSVVNAEAIEARSHSLQQAPDTPEFRPPQFPAYENDLIFGIFNPNGDGSTEIYRSLAQTDGFELVASIPASDDHFLDRDLKSNTTYYYKLRAEIDGQYSDYSGVVNRTTGYKLYPPLLSAEAISSTTVEITVQDASYNDVSYDLWRDHEADGVFIKTISAPDSGDVFVITDTDLLPNTTYTYRLDVRAQGPGNVFYPGMVNTSVTTLAEESLTPPVLTFHEPPTHFTCGNEIGLFYNNPNEEAMTEVYRSTNGEDFELILTAEGSGSFTDQDLASAKTYYYKAQAFRGNETSEFSPVVSTESGYAFYPPEIEVNLLPDQTVEVKVHDRSYLDYSYELYGWNADEGTYSINQTFQLLDSGETFMVVDNNVIAGETYTYHVNVTLDCDGYPTVDEEFVSDPVTIRDSLAAPEFVNEPPFEFYCESTIAFDYINPNEGTQTEIYRSTSEDTGFTRIAIADGGGRYVDESVNSNIVYYYKLRAVADGMASKYSDAWHLLSPSDFYYPELSAGRVVEGVELQLLDRSYGDLHYDLKRHETGTDNWINLPVTITMPDSGSVYTYVDASALPNTAYRYYVDATQDCDGQPQHYEIAYADVGPGNMPTVFNFTLVDPVTDMDVGEMYDGIEFNVNDRLNIRANTNTATKSVAFFINGQRYWGENEVPYALFGDRYANYNRGRFRPGAYTVTAVPYSENLHTGIAGEPRTIRFAVVDDHGNANARTFVEVNVFPNPVVERATIEIAGNPNAAVTFEITDNQGTSLARSTESLDNHGWITKEWEAGHLRSGVYFLMIGFDGKSFTRRMMVE